MEAEFAAVAATRGLPYGAACVAVRDEVRPHTSYPFVEGNDDKIPYHEGLLVTLVGNYHIHVQAVTYEASSGCRVKACMGASSYISRISPSLNG